MFGIAFTSSAINFLDTLERRQDPKYASLQQHFGSLDVSILTLYMSMTGGQNWGVYYEALTTVPGGEFTCILFIVYITFAAWQQAECVVWYVWCHFSIMMDHANTIQYQCLVYPYPLKLRVDSTLQGPLRRDQHCDRCFCCSYWERAAFLQVFGEIWRVTVFSLSVMSQLFFSG